MRQPPNGRRVDDAVAVALEDAAIRRLGLGMRAPAAIARAHGVRSEGGFEVPFEVGAGAHEGERTECVREVQRGG